MPQIERPTPFNACIAFAHRHGIRRNHIPRASVAELPFEDWLPKSHVSWQYNIGNHHLSTAAVAAEEICSLLEIWGDAAGHVLRACACARDAKASQPAMAKRCQRVREMLPGKWPTIACFLAAERMNAAEEPGGADAALAWLGSHAAWDGAPWQARIRAGLAQSKCSFRRVEESRSEMAEPVRETFSCLIRDAFSRFGSTPEPFNRAFLRHLAAFPDEAAPELALLLFSNANKELAIACWEACRLIDKNWKPLDTAKALSAPQLRAAPAASSPYNAHAQAWRECFTILESLSERLELADAAPAFLNSEASTRTPRI